MYFTKLHDESDIDAIGGEQNVTANNINDDVEMEDATQFDLVSLLDHDHYNAAEGKYD